MKHESIQIAQSEKVKDFINDIAGYKTDGGTDRAKRIMHRLISDLFQLIDDLDVRPEEFWSAVDYINELGTAKEAGLLTPGLGIERYLDMRMDAEDEKAKQLGGTPRTIEGPLYIPGAPVAEGFARMDDGVDKGEVMWLHGHVYDADTGKPLRNAKVEVWHCDSKGNYSFFDSTQSEYNLRRSIMTDADGRYRAQSIVPSGYGCPPEGPTQRLLNQLGRHGQRPAHIHFFVSAEGYEHLTTQLNLSDDELLHDDFAYATRDELIVDVIRNSNSEEAGAYGLEAPFSEVSFDFRLRETSDPKRREAVVRQHAIEVD